VMIPSIYFDGSLLVNGRGELKVMLGDLEEAAVLENNFHLITNPYELRNTCNLRCSEFMIVCRNVVILIIFVFSVWMELIWYVGCGGVELSTNGGRDLSAT